MAVFWHVGGGSKIKSAITVCSLDRSEIQSTGAGLQRCLGFALAWKEPAGQGCISWAHFYHPQLVRGQNFMKVFIGSLHENLNYCGF